MRACPRCGAAYRPADPECPHCGLVFPDAVVATALIPPPRTTKSSERPWIVRGARLVGVLVLVFVALHYVGVGVDSLSGEATGNRSTDLPGPSQDDSGDDADKATLPNLNADGLPVADNLAESATITADETGDPGKDGAGNTITYGTENLVDQDLETAWRAPGYFSDDSDNEITITLPTETTIQVVGLTNGYTKVDATSGEDRYTAGRRITSVTWLFDDGTSVDQSLKDGSRKTQMTTISAVTTKTVRLRVNSTTTPGKFTDDYTAITELFLGAG